MEGEPSELEQLCLWAEELGWSVLQVSDGHAGVQRESVRDRWEVRSEPPLRGGRSSY